MEAARVAAIRGHHVDLYESGEELGGVVIAGGMPDFKKDDHALIAWYEDQLKDLGVNVRFNTEIDADAIKAAKADAVIVATGATAKMLSIPGAKNLFSATDVLLGKADPGESVLIVGGGLVGCEIALWLAEKGKHVTIVEVMDGLLKLAGPLCHANSDMLLELLHFKKVDVITGFESCRRAAGRIRHTTPRRRTIENRESRFRLSRHRLQSGNYVVQPCERRNLEHPSYRRCTAGAKHHVRNMGRLRSGPQYLDLTPFAAGLAPLPAYNNYHIRLCSRV